MKTYEFSCWIRCKRQRLKRRPWWNLFGRDALEWYTANERVSMMVEEPEAEVLIDFNPTSRGWPNLFIRALGHGEENKISDMVLEEYINVSDYVTTYSNPTNHLGSEDFTNTSWVKEDT